MRTTNQIICAVKDSEPVTHEELRLALLALNGIEYFVRKSLRDIIEVLESGKPKVLVDLRVTFAKQTLESMFTAIKTDPEKWLGPANILFKRATGEDL